MYYFDINARVDECDELNSYLSAIYFAQERGNADVLHQQALASFQRSPARSSTRMIDFWGNRTCIGKVPVPKLKLVAIAIANVRAQSASAERAASTAGNIDSKKRSKLSATTFEMLSFLADNTHLVGDADKVKSVTYRRARQVLETGCNLVRAKPLTEEENKEIEAEESELAASVAAMFAKQPEQDVDEEDTALPDSDSDNDSDSDDAELAEVAFVKRAQKANRAFKKNGILGLYAAFLGNDDDDDSFDDDNARADDGSDDGP